MTEHESHQRLNAITGTFFLFLGGILSALVFLDRWTSIGVRFPDVWYVSRNFHLAACVSFFVVGWWAHRCAAAEAQAHNATPPMFHTLRVYTKPECKLCDQALDIIQIYAADLPPVQLVDISGNPALEEKHGEWIPVVEIDGRVRFRGIVSAELLSRLIVAQQRRITAPSK
jgi:hypothetical protein